MRKSIILLALFFSLFGCQKKDLIPTHVKEEEYTGNRKLLSDHFKDLKIETFNPVIISKSRKFLDEIIASKKLNTLLFLRDSSWSYGLGKSSFYESDDMIVTPDNESYVYPGSIIKSASISTGDFAPLKGYTKKPIQVGVTFPSGKGYGSIASPSLSGSRIFLRDALMDPGFVGTQLLDFLFASSAFSYFNETKLSYGYNLNEKRLFSSVNTSFNNTSGRTDYSTGLIATYTVKNFQYYMEDPLEGELLDVASLPAGTLEGVSPVYINSVTYGRFGFLLIETNNNSSQTQMVFEKLVKKLFNKTQESLTMEEKTLVESSRITLYLLGSPNGASITQLLINPGAESLSDFISESLGSFTALDPGVPISFTAKYLKDNSKFKTVFQLDFPN